MSQLAPSRPSLTPPAVPVAAATRVALKAEVMRLMQDFSVEVTPAGLLALQRFPPGLAAGSRVYVTSVPGSSFDNTLVACGRLRGLGMVPVPHVAARAIVDTAQWQDRLQALKQRAGVDQMLLVAGSQSTPLGAFRSSLDMLNGGLVARPGMASLALAAHPEGSPSITENELARALRHKNEFAMASGLPTRLVTQFVFDAQPVLAWEERARSEGNRLPVHLGLAGLASVPTLLRYARLCGVGASMQVLARQRGHLLKLVSGVDPGSIVVAVAHARLRDPACLIQRLHFFPFGALQPTLVWASAVARGDFEVSQDHKHLEVATMT